MIFIFMIKNRGQNAHMYVFIINKRRFLAACTLHRTLRGFNAHWITPNQ